ncbi:transcription factor hoxa13 [Hirsutella rhossiliensis]|uniref:Transcription factor hoxa13 n=1 Tax=Hirsutella rhossiliensis TaxID=111463 RepID=A0A9P8N7N6_9HYPO|nr:transcription factor hoxa13 [Hirsutella rhossiliensis]KAH0966132.1 transcription factor hoxa13 [Hirsutella rhossiliensis]
MADSGGPLKSSNGSSHVANGKPHRKPVVRTTSTKQRRGFFAWAFSLAARLAIWSAIFTVLFRCPSSIDACDDKSPFICEHYFRAKDAVSPHLQPYYDQYAAPYVNVARPYYDAVNTRVLTPTRAYAVHYGAPWVQRGQDYAWSQWQLNGQPRLARMQTVVKDKYDQSVAPHLAKVGETVEPYYQIARTNSLQLFYEHLLPGYELVRPYAARSYHVASDFAVNTALPITHWAWDRSNVFLETTVWPQLRLVYVENVEPQLVRIGERLGRYKNKAKSKVLPRQPSKAGTSTESFHSSFSKPTPQSSTPEPTRAQGDAVTVATKQADPQGSAGKLQYPVGAPPKENETDEDRTVREMVAHDLQSWQEKIATQAKEGATENEERTDAIARRFIQEKVEVIGRQLIEQLNVTVQSELADVKHKVVSIAKDPSEDAEDKAVGAVRSAGLAIKGKAQAVREWHEEYLAELQKTVLDAANEFFVILAETQSLALQKIGMKWAWIDGITYRDWAKYHELRATLSQWTDELKELITGHPTLLEAQGASAQIENEAMEIASAAAKELARLKQVAVWKIRAGDSTDNFDSDAMRLAAEAAQEAGRVKATVAEAGEEVLSTAKGIAEEGTSTAKVIPSAVVGGASKAASSLSEAAIGSTSNPNQAPPRKSARSVQDGDAASENEPHTAAAPGPADAAENILRGTPLDAVSSETGDAATSAVAEAPEANGENLKDTEEDARIAADMRRESGSPPVHGAMFGAAAQAVSDRGPILDESPDPDRYGSATAAAQAAYTSALSAASAQYSSALSVVSAQVYGTPKPVHEQLFSSVSTAYDNAVGAAGQRLNDAVSAASKGVYGEPTPTSKSGAPGWQKVESMAAQRLSEGRLWAEIQYQSALLALGVVTSTPTPTPSNAAEKLVEQAKFNYYAGLGMAQDRYMSFLSGASSAWSLMTATPTPTDLVGSASSVASAAGKSATSAAQAAGSAAQSAYSAATEGVVSAANAVEDSFSAVADAAGEQVYLAGSALAGTWDKVVSELSAQVYAEPSAIGWYDELAANVGSYASAATKTAADAQQYEAMSEMVSELVSGREPAFSESVLSRFGVIYATASASVGSMASEASAAASSLGDKVGSVASKATDAVKEGVGRAKDEL